MWEVTEQIVVQTEEEWLVVTLSGQFIGGDETDEMRKVLGSGSVAGKQVIVDMTLVSFVNSSFLGALLASHASQARKGGQIHIVGLQEQLLQLFRITKLDAVIPIAESVEEVKLKSKKV